MVIYIYIYIYIYLYKYIAHHFAYKKCRPYGYWLIGYMQVFCITVFASNTMKNFVCTIKGRHFFGRQGFLHYSYRVFGTIKLCLHVWGWHFECLRRSKYRPKPSLGAVAIAPIAPPRVDPPLLGSTSGNGKKKIAGVTWSVSGSGKYKVYA